MSTATLSDNRCVSARANIPAWGCWYADAVLDDEVTLSGAVTLELADLALRGTIVSGGPYKGRSTYRVVGGTGGWGKTIERRGYANDAGVRLANVLTDAAQAAGETLDATTVAESTIGPAWVREEGPASRALELLAKEAWYVGEDGITRLGRRAAVEFAADAERIAQDLARGTIKLAADAIATILPGAIVDGVEAVDVLHELNADGLRSTIWGKGVGTTSRRLSALRRVVAQLMPDYKFRGVTEYRVVTLDGNRLNLQAVRVSSGMPDLQRVRVRPGVAGCKATVALGSSVLVAFIDGDPGRPIVVGFEDADGAGFAAVVDVGLSAEAVAIASKVHSRFTEFMTPFTATVPVPGDGGAAIQTAVKTALTAAGWTSASTVPPTTASSNLRAKP